ncbi:aminotransferase class I/II-fold pyridoxal phosphate-dependent enzyme [uncultured Ruthenibacterium sp.]|uniref:aminotransferase class I/II-fold pyridoxal phosphate-dependent enzyme n=1 Tax=uncultured Ruthenibacterium sp. TaxID=1905347 RepID=UPI00349EB1F9
MRQFLAKEWQVEESNPLMTTTEKAKKYSDIINLSIGDPDLPVPAEILEKAAADVLAGYTKYSDPWGYADLRQAIVDFYKEDYGVDIAMENVFVTAAGCAAMSLVLEAVLEEGDEVLLFDPYFSAYDQQVRVPGGVPVCVPCFEFEDWQPSAQRAEQYLSKRTKAMILNTPNNPTGVCYSDKTLHELAEFSKKHDLLVIADDIYTSFVYGGAKFVPIMSLPGMAERTVTVNSFSKNYVMTGLRIGNIVAPGDICRAVKHINECVVYSAPSYSQRAALYALQKRHEYARQIVPEFEKRMAYGAKRIRAIPAFTLSPAAGGIYLFPGIKKTGLTSMEVCQRILDEAHVLMVPGSAFGDAGEGYLRIACTVGVDKMAEAFDRLEKMPLLQGK